MLLIDGKENALKLTIVGYQFRGPNNNEYDDNWLNILIEATHPRGEWKATDPSLLTWEVSNLIDWLRAVAAGSNRETEVDFMEPNLRFEFIDNDSKKLRVYFEVESRPNWAPYTGAGMEDLWLEFEFRPRDLLAAADSLESDLKKFPRRVRNDNRV